MAKTKSKSSSRWLERQHSDPYTQQAKKLGYRGRAAFKLLEIQERDKILAKGMTVVDLRCRSRWMVSGRDKYYGSDRTINCLR